MQHTLPNFRLPGRYPLHRERNKSAIFRRLGATLLVLTLLGLSATVNAAGSLTFTSGQSRVNLLELYTSEGCSSCPPADAWFATLVDHPQLWQRIVPVAFHVDYWNYLGWKDPLSDSAYSQRQRQYKREGAVNAVYTPGVINDGREWRGWRNLKDLTRTGAPAGSLTVKVDHGVLKASYDDGADAQTLELQVALLGFDLTTQVAAGENRGKTLTHQFAVLAHEAATSDHNQWEMPLPTSTLQPGKLGLAVWVTTPDSQQPLQATGGWLPTIEPTSDG